MRLSTAYGRAVCVSISPDLNPSQHSVREKSRPAFEPPDLAPIGGCAGCIPQGEADERGDILWRTKPPPDLGTSTSDHRPPCQTRNPKKPAGSAVSQVRMSQTTEESIKSSRASSARRTLRDLNAGKIFCPKYVEEAETRRAGLQLRHEIVFPIVSSSRKRCVCGAQLFKTEIRSIETALLSDNPRS